MKTLPTLAIIGCGRVSPRHFESVPGLFDLVAICDSDLAAREVASQAHKVPGYATIEALFQEIQPDVVALATPSGLHTEQAIQCAKLGAHVITEKPLAIRWSDGLRMVEGVEAAGKRLFEVKQNRFSPHWQHISKLIAQRAFGQIYSVQANLFWTRPQDYYDLAPWRGTWEMDGGALMNQAIHHVDILRWLFGPVECVQAMTGTLARRIEVEDTATVLLKFRNGTMGNIHVSMLAPNRNVEASLTIIAEHGVVKLGGPLCDQIELWDSDATPPPQEDSKSIYGNGHPLFYADVHRALKTGERGLLEGHEGLKALEIVIAAYRSAAEGKRVALPLKELE